MAHNLNAMSWIFVTQLFVYFILYAVVSIIFKIRKKMSVRTFLQKKIKLSIPNDEKIVYIKETSLAYKAMYTIMFVTTTSLFASLHWYMIFAACWIVLLNGMFKEFILSSRAFYISRAFRLFSIERIPIENARFAPEANGMLAIFYRKKCYFFSDIPLFIYSKSDVLALDREVSKDVK